MDLPAGPGSEMSRKEGMLSDIIGSAGELLVCSLAGTELSRWGSVSVWLTYETKYQFHCHYKPLCSGKSVASILIKRISLTYKVAQDVKDLSGQSIDKNAFYHLQYLKQSENISIIDLILV